MKKLGYSNDVIARGFNIQSQNTLIIPSPKQCINKITHSSNNINGSNKQQLQEEEEEEGLDTVNNNNNNNNNVLNYDVDNMILKDVRLMNCSVTRLKDENIMKYVRYVNNYLCSNELVQEVAKLITENIYPLKSPHIIIELVHKMEETYPHLVKRNAGGFLEALHKIKIVSVKNLHEKNDEHKNNFEASISTMLNFGYRHQSCKEKAFRLAKDQVVDMKQFKYIDCIIEYLNTSNDEKRQNLDAFMLDELGYDYIHRC